ncbi:trypsin-like peptidase domain-containing protein [candidate division KSB1 bacterium]|nr:trypsin-like peptidase domain-containing protein [candidate division KSB1 bacterium]
MKKNLLLIFLLSLLLACQSDEKQPATTDLAAMTPQPVSQRSGQLVNDQISNSRRTAITRAVEKVSDAVCGINVTQIRQARRSNYYDDPFLRFFFPERIPRQAIKSLGSGFLISAEGFILTNEHVVSNASEIVVVLSDGSTHNAEVVGSDFITDIALIKIEGKNYNYIQFGNSEDVIIGEWVIALGNPFGLFEINSKPTVTVGVVSAVDRDFGRQSNDRVYQDMIQTDAAINQGNSGGPLVNSLGEVIGMNTFIYTGSDYNTGSIGLGFALPSNHIIRVIKDLKEYGEVNRRFRTGLQVDDISPIVARYFRLRSSNGVIVTDVERNSSAARAGLQVRDIILEVNGKKIEDENDIWSVIENSDLRGGDKLNFKVLRDQRILNISMKLESVN